MFVILLIIVANITFLKDYLEFTGNLIENKFYISLFGK